MRTGTKIIKSMFGVSIINGKGTGNVDLPYDAMSKLIGYMAYKTRDEETF